jgi:hypothetical protein
MGGPHVMEKVMISKSALWQRRWRAQQRAQGKRQLIVWLDEETVELLYAQAQSLEVPISELIGLLTLTDSSRSPRVAIRTSPPRRPSAVAQIPAKLPPARIPSLVRQAKNLHAQGLPWGGIAAQWNTLGVPTASGIGQWHGSTVAKLAL